MQAVLIQIHLEGTLFTHGQICRNKIKNQAGDISADLINVFGQLKR